MKEYGSISLQSPCLYSLPVSSVSITLLNAFPADNLPHSGSEATIDVGEASINVGEAAPDVGEASIDVGEATPNVGEATTDAGEATPNVGGIDGLRSSFSRFRHQITRYSYNFC